MNEPIRLYFDRALMLPDMSYIPLLYPFLGPIFKESTPYVNAVYHQHIADGSCFELVNIPEQADYVLIPHPYHRLAARRPDVLAQMLTTARRTGRPVLIDGSGDLEYPITIPHSVVLRVSQYRFLARPNEITIPLDAEDLGETFFDNMPPIRPKTDHASIGFSGWGRLGVGDRFKAELRFLPWRLLSVADSRYGAFKKGVLMREKATRALARSKLIEPHLVIRNSYSGNLRTLQGDPHANRRAFVDNLVSSDYALSVRGDGNVDVRLYEALSLGCIPVIIDTERVLPLEDQIDYRRFAVFVDFRKIATLDQFVAEFHACISPDEFEAMQRRAREAFTTYLRPDRFTPYLTKMLRARV